MRDYQKLSIEDFGRQLIESGDLDPVYIMLHKAELEHGQLRRWLLAYWCLYHCGAASYLSEQTGPHFWVELRAAAANTACPAGERWPRGHERRHWRGSAAMTSANKLAASLVMPERFCLNIEEKVPGLPAPFEYVSRQAQAHNGFGPWIAFKVADMLDRLDILPVSFDQAEVFMFDDPRKAALQLWRTHHQMDEKAKPKNEALVIKGVVDFLIEEFKDLTAPPLHDRAIGLQEVETVLCKWKSHMNGHYPLMNDTTEIAGGLAVWADASPTARELIGHLPKGLEAVAA